MSLHSTEAYVGSRRTVFLGAEDLHYEFVLWTGGEGESERTPRLAKNNDERVAAAAIVSPPRHYSESISWVGPPVQRGLVFTLGMPGDDRTWYFSAIPVSHLARAKDDGAASGA